MKKKLCAWHMDSWTVLRRIELHAYDWVVIQELGVGLVINIEDLTTYHMPVDNLAILSPTTPLWKSTDIRGHYSLGFESFKSEEHDVDLTLKICLI